MKSNWDYSDRAASYDKRADYSSEAIEALLTVLDCKQDHLMADIGAGTGKLSIPLLKRGFNVICVEPNDNMRNIGINNTRNYEVKWLEGTGENTNIKNLTNLDNFFVYEPKLVFGRVNQCDFISENFG